MVPLVGHCGFILPHGYLPVLPLHTHTARHTTVTTPHGIVARVCLPHFTPHGTRYYPCYPRFTLPQVPPDDVTLLQDYAPRGSGCGLPTFPPHGCYAQFLRLNGSAFDPHYGYYGSFARCRVAGLPTHRFTHTHRTFTPRFQHTLRADARTPDRPLPVAVHVAIAVHTPCRLRAPFGCLVRGYSYHTRLPTVTRCIYRLRWLDCLPHGFRVYTLGLRRSHGAHTVTVTTHWLRFCGYSVVRLFTSYRALVYPLPGCLCYYHAPPHGHLPRLRCGSGRRLHCCDSTHVCRCPGYGSSRWTAVGYGYLTHARRATFYSLPRATVTVCGSLVTPRLLRWLVALRLLPLRLDGALRCGLFARCAPHRVYLQLPRTRLVTVTYGYVYARLHTGWTLPLWLVITVTPFGCGCLPSACS